MNKPSVQSIHAVLEYGPFPKKIVEEWPEAMREDYLDLMGVDVEEMGIDEFRRLARHLGMAYLVSLGKPIDSDETLLKSWREVADEEPPPPLPKFSRIDVLDDHSEASD